MGKPSPTLTSSGLPGNPNSATLSSPGSSPKSAGSRWSPTSAGVGAGGPTYLLKIHPKVIKELVMGERYGWLLGKGKREVIQKHFGQKSAIFTRPQSLALIMILLCTLFTFPLLRQFASNFLLSRICGKALTCFLLQCLHHIIDASPYVASNFHTDKAEDLVAVALQPSVNSGIVDSA